MAKRRRTGNGPKLTGNFNLGSGGGPTGGLASKIQELQQQMEETQNSLSDETVEITSGGGVVKIEITGDQRITRVEIDPAVVDPDDVEMLQDVVMAAFNEAIEKSKEMASERMEGVTGDLSGLGLNIPGLF
jgi:DNA-binding YbaB/EbfC family protein